jgi:hypothetical protein
MHFFGENGGVLEREDRGKLWQHNAKYLIPVIVKIRYLNSQWVLRQSWRLVSRIARRFLVN